MKIAMWLTAVLCIAHVAGAADETREEFRARVAAVDGKIWTMAAYSEDGSTVFYFAPNRVTRVVPSDNNVIKAWELMLSLRKDKDVLDRTISKAAFSCQAGVTPGLTMTEQTTFYLKGEAVRTHRGSELGNDGEWHEELPGTVGENLMNTICAYAKGKN